MRQVIFISGMLYSRLSHIVFKSENWARTVKMRQIPSAATTTESGFFTHVYLSICAQACPQE